MLAFGRSDGSRRSSRCVIVRCDGDEVVGLGHVGRCLGLAGSLQSDFGWTPIFAMNTGPAGFEMARSSGFTVEQPGHGSEQEWLSHLLSGYDAAALVLDVRPGLPRHVLSSWVAQGRVVATLDDFSDQRLGCSLAFYPPVPQIRRLDWNGFEGRWFAGWEWVLVRQEFAAARRRQSAPRDSDTLPRLLITMGGSDPSGMTFRAVQALSLVEPPCRPVVVLGPAFNGGTSLETELSKLKQPVELLRSPDDMAEIIASSDLGLISFGVTAYELAVLGIPGIYLSLTADHAVSASYFEESGLGLSLGLSENVEPPAIAAALNQLLRDGSRRLGMSRQGRLLLDGLGANRIAGTILKACQLLRNKDSIEGA